MLQLCVDAVVRLLLRIRGATLQVAGTRLLTASTLSMLGATTTGYAAGRPLVGVRFAGLLVFVVAMAAAILVTVACLLLGQTDAH